MPPSGSALAGESGPLSPATGRQEKIRYLSITLDDVRSSSMIIVSL